MGQAQWYDRSSLDKEEFTMIKYIDPKANTYSLIDFQSRFGTE